MEIKQEEDPNLEVKNDFTDQIQSQTFTNSRNDQNQNSATEEINPLEEIASDPQARTQDSTEAGARMPDNNQLREEFLLSKRRLMKSTRNSTNW